MYKNNKSNKSKQIPHLDGDDVYTWDNYDLHHQYNEEIDSFPPTMKQNVSTQTHEDEVKSIRSMTQKHPIVVKNLLKNSQPLKQHKTISTQTPNQSSTSSTQTTPIFSTTAATQTPPCVSNFSTQTPSCVSNSSTQTEQQKENKFSLFHIFY